MNNNKEVGKMGLELEKKRWKGSIKWIVLAVVVLVIGGLFIRLVTWEDSYYREKEGSERSVVEKSEDSREELIEVAPTDDEVREYTVAPERPRLLTIDKLGIHGARILPIGIDDEGQLGTPNNIFDVGWYESSGLPGGGGTLLIDGHNGGPHVHGVFKDLPELAAGDIIEVERGDGTIFQYSVVESTTVSLDESDMYMGTAMRSPEAGKESLTLISCTGEWSDERSTYLARQFVRAVLMPSQAEATNEASVEAVVGPESTTDSE